MSSADQILTKMLHHHGTDCVVLSKAHFEAMRKAITEAGLADRLAAEGVEFSALELDEPADLDTATDYGVSVWVGPSAGSDGAVLVIIDTEFEPDGSDGGPGLRVMINDGDGFVGVPWAPKENEDGDG